MDEIKQQAKLDANAGIAPRSNDNDYWNAYRAQEHKNAIADQVGRDLGPIIGFVICAAAVVLVLGAFLAGAIAIAVLALAFVVPYWLGAKVLSRRSSVSAWTRAGLMIGSTLAIGLVTGWGLLSFEGDAEAAVVVPALLGGPFATSYLGSRLVGKRVSWPHLGFVTLVVSWIVLFCGSIVIGSVYKISLQ